MSHSIVAHNTQPLIRETLEGTGTLTNHSLPWYSMWSSTEEEGLPFTVMKLQGCLKTTESGFLHTGAGTQ